MDRTEVAEMQAAKVVNEVVLPKVAQWALNIISGVVFFLLGFIWNLNADFKSHVNISEEQTTSIKSSLNEIKDDIKEMRNKLEDVRGFQSKQQAQIDNIEKRSNR